MRLSKPDKSGVMTRLVALNQYAFNAVLLGIGAWLMWSGDRRGGFLMLLVLGAFVPFSFSRLGLQRYLDQHLARTFLVPLALTGLLFDWIMAVQIL